MSKNDKYFEPPLITETFLTVRGFDGQGRRSGGIVDPVVVEIPTNTLLFRLYHDSRRRFGEWWFTPNEMKQVVNHFGLYGTAAPRLNSRPEAGTHRAAVGRNQVTGWGDLNH